MIDEVVPAIALAGATIELHGQRFGRDSTVVVARRYGLVQAKRVSDTLIRFRLPYIAETSDLQVLSGGMLSPVQSVWVHQDFQFEIFRSWWDTSPPGFAKVMARRTLNSALAMRWKNKQATIPPPLPAFAPSSPAFGTWTVEPARPVGPYEGYPFDFRAPSVPGTSSVTAWIGDQVATLGIEVLTATFTATASKTVVKEIGDYKVWGMTLVSDGSRVATNPVTYHWDGTTLQSNGQVWHFPTRPAKFRALIASRVDPLLTDGVILQIE